MAKQFGQVTIVISDRLLNLGDEYAKQVRSALEDVALELATELQIGSPRGVTGGLQESWDVTPAARQRNTLNVKLEIKNDAPAAYFRIVGRGPGKMPPVDAVRRWAVAKGISPYLVARKIGREGTERWKSGQNILGINPQTGKYKADSIVLRYQEEALKRVRAIKIL